jgi:hypothetical protein
MPIIIMYVLHFDPRRNMNQFCQHEVLSAFLKVGTFFF